MDSKVSMPGFKNCLGYFLFAAVRIDPKASELSNTPNPFLF